MIGVSNRGGSVNVYLDINIAGNASATNAWHDDLGCACLLSAVAAPKIISFTSVGV